jgi:hypothetical protein
MTASTVVALDPRADLIEDLARDPEGHFHQSIDGDRRLPPWFGSASGSQAPEEITDRLYRFIEERCTGQPPAEYDLRHNWFDRQIEFIRWIPDFESCDRDEKIALITWTPLTLKDWRDRAGWLPGGEALFDYLWLCFMTNDADLRRQERHAKEREDARVYVQAHCSRVSQGVATEEELDEYEHQLRIADPEQWAESHELAKDLVPILKKEMDELGI